MCVYCYFCCISFGNLAPLIGSVYEPALAAAPGNQSWLALCEANERTHLELGGVGPGGAEFSAVVPYQRARLE